MKKLSLLYLMAMVLFFAPSERLAAQSFKTIYDFPLVSPGSPPINGAGPLALAQASDGNLYVTTEIGANLCGNVVRISTNGDFTLLHSFSVDDGDYPNSLVQAGDGNLYGTTQYDNFDGYGTVFRISTGGDFTLLYSFSGGDDSAYPQALVQATDGNLYGTTAGGLFDTNSSSFEHGTVFRITLDGDLTTLYSFAGGDDGSSPYNLIQASDGNLYGTDGGGKYGYGTVFRISLNGDLTTLYSFAAGDDGGGPVSLIQASDGNLYGTDGGGKYSYGTVFRISTNGDFTTLYTFSGGDDGSYPYNLIQASDGNLYGTDGGGKYDYGTVFRISLNGDFKTVYSFSGGDDGGSPDALVPASNGNFYGTTGGGTNNNGTVFSISLPLIAASSLSWNADLSGWLVAFGYAADGSLATNTTAALYWADGTDISDVISDDPLWTANIPAGFNGESTSLVPATALQNPPNGTSNLLFVVDPDNLITPPDPTDKTLSLKWVELGVDVSHLQNDAGGINWSAVKNGGATFVYVTASQGTNVSDNSFAGNIQGAFSVGLFVAPYHVAGTGSGTTNSPLILGDPVAEATNFLNQSKRYIGNGYLPPMLDLKGDFSGDDVRYQNPTGMSVQQWVTAWLQYVQQQTGVMPGIYAAKVALTNLDSSLVVTNTLWIANNSGSPIVTPSLGTNIWANWNFQQWSTNGSCLGISGNVDLDSFNGDLAALDALTVNPASTNPSPVSLSGVGGGAIQAPANNQFQLQAFAPGQSQVTIQTSGDLEHWTDMETVSVANGIGIFTDMSAGGTMKFYRVKP